MFRHQRKKWLFEDLIPSGEGPYVYESEVVLEFVKETQGDDLRTKHDNVHAPTDLTYLVQNDYDVDVSVQPIGGVYDAINDVWIMKCDVGDPVVIAAGTTGYVDVFPGEPYMQDYTAELTWAELGLGEEGADVLAIFVIDQ